MIARLTVPFIMIEVKDNEGGIVMLKETLNNEDVILANAKNCMSLVQTKLDFIEHKMICGVRVEGAFKGVINPGLGRKKRTLLQNYHPASPGGI